VVALYSSSFGAWSTPKGEEKKDVGRKREMEREGRERERGRKRAREGERDAKLNYNVPHDTLLQST
jgi:hypothetical protein